jgi:hypothetical protein
LFVEELKKLETANFFKFFENEIRRRVRRRILDAQEEGRNTGWSVIIVTIGWPVELTPITLWKPILEEVEKLHYPTTLERDRSPIAHIWNVDALG